MRFSSGSIHTLMHIGVFMLVSGFIVWKSMYPIQPISFRVAEFVFIATIVGYGMVHSWHRGEKIRKQGSVFVWVLVLIASGGFLWASALQSSETQTSYAYPLLWWYAGMGLFSVIFSRRLRSWVRRLLSHWGSMIEAAWAEKTIARPASWFVPSVVVSSIVIVGFVVRVINLDQLWPYVDEYAHLWASGNLLLGEEFSDVYQRSFWMVTQPVVWSVKVLGATLWAARFPGVLISTLAIVPLYVLGRMIHRHVGLVAAALYALSPWLIGTSRTIREYAYHPVWYLLTALLIAYMLRMLVSHPSVRQKGNWALIGTIVLALLPLAYGLWADTASTFRIVTVVYASGFVLVFMQMVRSRVSRHVFSVCLVGIVSVAFLTLGELEFSQVVRSTTIGDRIHLEWLALFFTNAQQHWFAGQSMLVVFAVLLAAVFAAIRIQNRVLQLSLITFLLSLGLYVFYLNRAFNPRYAVFIQLWYILLLATGLVVLFVLLRRIMPRATAAVLLLGLFWHVPQTFIMPFNQTQGFQPITWEFHGDAGPMLMLLDQELVPDDHLVTTFAISSIRLFRGWGNSYTFYDYNTPDQDLVVAEAVKNNGRGWILLDRWRNGEWVPGIPKTDQVIAGKDVVFRGLYGDIHVYQWGGE